MRISNHKPVNRCSEFTLLQSLLASDPYLPQNLLASEFTRLRPLLQKNQRNARVCFK